MKGIKFKNLTSLWEAGLSMANKNLPSILSGFAIFGVVATAYTAFKAAPDVKSALNAKKWEKQVPDSDDEDTVIEDTDVELTVWETVTAAAPYIWRPVVCGAATVGCIVGAQVLNVQRLTMLAGAYKLSEEKLKKYEEKAKELLGEKKAEEIHSEVVRSSVKEKSFTASEVVNTGRGDKLFYDPWSGRAF